MTRIDEIRTRWCGQRWGDSCVDIADDALKDIPCLLSEIERLTPKALSIEYLKQISEDADRRRWVWIEARQLLIRDEIKSAYYRAQPDYTQGEAFCCGYPGSSFCFKYADYGKSWVAYDREFMEDKS